MFGTLQDMMKRLQTTQRLLKDDTVRALVQHPKVQELFKDPQVLALIKAQDSAEIIAHPKFAALMRDPELAPLLAKLTPQSFRQA